MEGWRERERDRDRDREREDSAQIKWNRYSDKIHHQTLRM